MTKLNVKSLNIKPKTGCQWDLVSLGEVMLRLDPGDERISTTRHFRAWEANTTWPAASDDVLG
jgi:2-dehydro-3-deoxygluconokinase